MGNRAVITTSKSLDVKSSSDIGVYLHWNGGRDSVEAFLEYCKLKGYKSPEQDCYGYARLCQVIGNFFGGGSSLGIEKCCNLDCANWDNGVYIIEDWKIVDRKYFAGYEQDEHDLQEMLVAIDESMPAEEQLGKDFLRAEIVPISKLKIGDEVFVQDWNHKVTKTKVMGFGENGRIVNGTDIGGIPYVGIYGDDHADNINNYLIRKDIRRVQQ